MEVTDPESASRAKRRVCGRCPTGRTIWIADAHRDDEKRFIVRADQKLTAFLELERAVCISLLTEQL
jgi:hypothetical protein